MEQKHDSLVQCPGLDHRLTAAPEIAAAAATGLVKRKMEVKMILRLVLYLPLPLTKLKYNHT